MTWIEVVTAVSGALTALFTAALAVMAWIGWRTAKATLKAATASAEAARAANEQARADSIEQTRPYVFVEMAPGLSGVGCWDVRITNSGRSMARHLVLDYDGWPDDLDDVGQAVRTLFTTPRVLPPGCSVRAIWRLDAGPGGTFTDGTTAAGMATAGTIRASYTGDSTSPTYTDEFEVEVMIDKSGLWPAGEAGATPGKFDSGDLKQLYKLGQVLVRRIAELTR